MTKVYEKPRFIAEIGCNHKGDIDLAREMITIAKVYCKADVVKFQKRNNRELLTPEQFNAPHPNPINSYGKTYGEHREFLEFTIEEHHQLKQYCDKLGIVYSTSVWDMTSAQEIASLNPEMIKIPSAINNHYPMLSWLCDHFHGEIHVSVGMTTKAELDDLMHFFKERRRNQDVVLYSCTSGYPVSADDVSLLEISYLSERFGKDVKHIGFSGHHLGIALDIAAYTLGATWIERHFTLDRTWKGTDHSASLEPDDAKRLVDNLDDTYKALTFKREDILDIEKVQRKKLKYKG